MNDKSERMIRRDVLRGTLAVGGLLGASACAPTAARLGGAGLAYRPALRPLRISPDRIMELKCCLRPFRAMGPRLDAEQIGDKLVVYNYGHGGSGWSLSWGSAEIAVQKAMSVLPEEIAVIGCGIIGLTTAVAAQRAGAKVTIYTRDLLPQARSSRAWGSWTPDSRIALAEPAGPAFGALWERMARRSYVTFRSYLGLAGKPVDVNDNYAVSDNPFMPHEEKPDPAIVASYATTGMPQQNSEFGHYMDRIRDITPVQEMVDPASTPFHKPYVSRQSSMFFNFSSYGQLLMDQFYAAGGKVVMRTMRSAADMLTLKEPVIIPCLGYASRDILRDASLIPVRGQTAWLMPDPEMNYGLRYRGVGALAKADGIVVQNSGTIGEILGVGDSNEVPIREDTLKGIEILQSVFAPSAGKTA